ncbi:MAG: hypothetical protein QOD77_459 [Thermoplasmata archaeon]|jgi:hypothetical protein|nr:hypothetical protein [Thermoplasmata archaeon]
MLVGCFLSSMEWTLVCLRLKKQHYEARVVEAGLAGQGASAEEALQQAKAALAEALAKEQRFHAGTLVVLERVQAD